MKPYLHFRHFLYERVISRAACRFRRPCSPPLPPSPPSPPLSPAPVSEPAPSPRPPGSCAPRAWSTRINSSSESNSGRLVSAERRTKRPARDSARLPKSMKLDLLPPLPPFPVNDHESDRFRSIFQLYSPPFPREVNVSKRPFGNHRHQAAANRTNLHFHHCLLSGAC